MPDPTTSQRLHELAQLLEAPVFQEVRPSVVPIFLHPKTLKQALGVLAALSPQAEVETIYREPVILRFTCEGWEFAMFVPDDAIVGHTRRLADSLAEAIR